jgi:hypothetical protein
MCRQLGTGIVRRTFRMEKKDTGEIYRLNPHTGSESLFLDIPVNAGDKMHRRAGAIMHQSAQPGGHRREAFRG